MTEHCHFKHKPYFKIIYQKGFLPFTEYFVCRNCFDSGMPWNDPRGILSKRVIEVEKPKEE